MKGWVIGVLIFVCVAYVVVGGLIFMVLESSNEESTRTATGEYRSQFLANHSCVTEAEFDALVKVLNVAFQQGVVAENASTSETESTWTAHTSIYFAITVVTTIGYGNISPVTSGGRIFCVFFALVGIPLCLVVLAEIGKKLSKIITKFDDWLVKKTRAGVCQKHPKILKYIRFIVLHLIFVVLLIVIPSVIFMLMEEGWTYGDGLYYCIITMTTIGFGDYVAGFNDAWRNPMYKIMIASWILIGLAWMSVIISSVQELLDDKVAKLDTKVNTDSKAELDEKNNHEFEHDHKTNNTSEIYRKTEGAI